MDATMKLVKVDNLRVEYLDEGDTRLSGPINTEFEEGMVYLIACDSEWIRRGIFDALLLGTCAEGSAIISFLNSTTPNRDGFYHRVGAVTRKTKVYELFTVRELISRSIHLRLKLLPDQRRESVISTLEGWNLSSVADFRYRRLSRLEKACVLLAIETVHRPVIVFIHDFNHFDLSLSEEIESLFSLINGYSRTAGTTFVILSHQVSRAALPFIDRICILIMGQFYHIGAPSEWGTNLDGLVAKLNHYLVDSPISSDDIRSRADTMNALKTDVKQGGGLSDCRSNIITLDPTPAPSSFRRLLLLIRHQGRADIRNKSANLALLITNLVIYIIISFAFFQLPTNTSTGLSDRAGLLYFLSVNTFFANSISMMEKFDIYRKVTLMERSFNLFNAACWVGAQFVSMIPYRTLSFLTFGTATYYITGLRTDGFHHYLVYISTLLLLTYASATFGILISIVMRHLDFGQLIIPFFGIYFFIFGNLSTAPNATWILRWMQYIDPIFYSFQCLIQNEINGLQADNSNDIIDPSAFSSLFLSQNSYNILPIAACLPALAGFTLLFLIGSIIAYHYRFRPYRHSALK